MAYLRTPTGKRITATVEMVLVTGDILDVHRDEDGGYLLEFYDGGTEVHWDAGEQVTRFREGGTRPELVYQDADGDEWLEGDLELVEDAPDA